MYKKNPKKTNENNWDLNFFNVLEILLQESFDLIKVCQSTVCF